MSAAEWTLSQQIDFEGRIVRFDVLGDGPPLVVIHGTPWSSFNLRHIIHGLASRFQVFYYDLLGYGQSDKRLGDVSLGVQNRVLSRLLAHWQLDDPIMVGHDFGGATALRARLLDGHTYSRLVLIDAVAVAPWGSPFFRHVGEFEPAFAGLPPYFHEAICRTYIQSAATTPLAEAVLQATVAPWTGEVGQAAFYRQIAQASSRYTDEVEPAYGSITEPALVIWGEDDSWIPVAQGRKLAAALPNCRLKTIPGTGHLVIEEAPGAVLQQILHFLP